MRKAVVPPAFEAEQSLSYRFSLIFARGLSVDQASTSPLATRERNARGKPAKNWTR